MISFLFRRRSDKICGFTVCGHAMFADYGKDVVCASVSSAVMLAVNTITENFHIQSDVKVDENRITFEYKGNPGNLKDSVVVDKILSGLAQHIEFIKEDYAGCVKTEYSEV